MLAVLGTAVQENYHPLWGFNEKEMDGAIFHFQVRPPTHPTHPPTHPPTYLLTEREF